MAIKDWKKLEWNNTLSKGGAMWGNEKKGGMVFVSKSNNSSEWRFGGVRGNGYMPEKMLKSKPEAMKYARSYMRSH